ncbi:regulator [Nocardia huaxiensis]|uniref:Regulator n=1 Tax=Nocardia huaxiensis TaxID=2755382 RepID=A0A7D6VB62_9NOCA|nr:DUF5685 family protein [Nocardia huaxiensis]QLY30871.1 regulator [Nocardia huaxiensis]
MFGLLKPCAHSAAEYGIDATTWQTHMCGLCLGLRDGHGQLARAATNTDALVLGVLTEAQQPTEAERTTAAPCPLRGMRRVPVATAGSPGVQLAATASLLLGAAKIRDHVDDGQTGRLSTRPMRRVSTRWRTQARAAAAPIGLDIEPLIAAIDSQAELETRLSGELELDRLTAPTQVCAAELFAHTAILAGRPENAEALREAGWHFGRIAHLADAIEDLDEDRAAGRFNPLAATGTSAEDAHSLLRESNSALRAALARVALERVATVRWMLLDPLNGVVRRIWRVTGAVRACSAHACGNDHAAQSEDGVVAVVRGDTTKPPRHRKPGLLEGIGIILSQYCTGYACCKDHTRPCSGHRRNAWVDRCNCRRRCKNCCDACDCCSGCGDDCCCDGCCCDC